MSNQENIELEMIETDHHLKMGEALNRLRNNEDFQLVIEENYLKQKALASVSLLAVPQIVQEGRRPGIMEDLISCSNLQYFFATVQGFYEGCIDPILSDEEEAEIEAEETAANSAGVH